MRVLEIPEEHRPRRSHDSDHDHNYGVAEAFYDAVQSGNVNPRTDRIYIPVFWANSYHQQVSAIGYPFKAVPAIQQLLDDTLDPNEQYFTVARSDDGIYETLPPNVQVFGACRRSDVSIPLTSSVPYWGRQGQSVKLLASFAGCKMTGGPDPTIDNPVESVSNPEGVGTQVRRDMFAAFANRTDCSLIEERNGGRAGAWEVLTRLMQKSRFSLAPRGYAPASFRLYEAMAYGSIPVYISDELIVPFEDVLDWDQFCVFCTPEDLPGLPDRLAGIPDGWQQNALGMIAGLYPQYFDLSGTCQQIARILERESR